MACKDKTARAAYAKAYAAANREKLQAYHAGYHEKHREKLCDRSKEHYAANREQRLAGVREYRANNLEKIRAIDREEWQQVKADPEKLAAHNARMQKYVKNRCKIDPKFKLDRRVRNYVKLCVKVKNGHTWGVLGYSLDELYKHLEAQFTEGMTWENYGKGGWHIDHIIPVCSFVYTTSDEPAFKECWALTNLRPLWEEENLAKAKNDKKLSMHRHVQLIKNQ